VWLKSEPLGSATLAETQWLWALVKDADIFMNWLQANVVEQLVGVLIAFHKEKIFHCDIKVRSWPLLLNLS
jgi:hypothetical protein